MKKEVIPRTFFAVILLLSMVLPVEGGAAPFSFESHWKWPIAPQGKVPEGYSELEASLDPEDCGTCHEKEYDDWRTSRHRNSMGPGVTGQFHSPWLDDWSQLSCLQCHAPLSEQAPFLEKEDGSGLVKNPVFSPALKSEGLTCAGCHVRNHVRYGPRPSIKKEEDDPPHGGFVPVENFGAAEFCAPCHQFGPRDRRVSGKLVQDTYNEWKNSSYGKKGVTCTKCHMPGGRHFWKGIHDPEMVKSAVTINSLRKGQFVDITVTNSGAGHNFPTYITPKVVIRGSYINSRGEEMARGVEERHIGWDVPLDLSREYDDTRIAPGESFKARFAVKKIKGSRYFRVVIQVFPDYFYSRFFKSLIDSSTEGVDRNKMKKALEETKKSVFKIYEKSWKL